MCIQDSGIFDGPHDAASVRAIANWHTNVVRIPLNEDCWLGINSAPSRYSGSTYQQTIVDFVNLLNQNGQYVILELHWNAPGPHTAVGQEPMTDRDHAIDFWKSVASRFKNNTAVIFDLYNEPCVTDWKCWRDGGFCAGYPTAGMQEMINAVRNTGARNVIMAGGLQWANDLSQWLQYQPDDSLHNLAVSWHVYNTDSCNTTNCYDNIVGPIAAKLPIIAGEIGETDCDHGLVDQVMAWLDAHQQSYLGWTWNPGSCTQWPSLITDYTGTPSAYGIGLKNYLAIIAGQTR